MKSESLSIIRSPYFDATWYSHSQNLRLVSRTYSRIHYVLIGHRKSYDPNPIFDSEWYRYQCAELGLEKPRNAISHYIDEGWINGLDPHPLFSISWYLKYYKDVKLARIDPLRHYLKNGIKEDRCISGWFIASEAFELHEDIINEKQAVELCFSRNTLGAFAGRNRMKAPIESIK